VADNFPLRVLLATFGGWINRHQAQAIDYLVEENRVLKEQLGNKRLRLADDQRRRLAAKAKPLGRSLLDRVATIVTPDTIIRWHRKLIAAHHTYPHKTRQGRPGLMKSIREMIVRMATENASWGYLRISGEMKRSNTLSPEPPNGDRVVVDERLGGLLRNYRRTSALGHESQRCSRRQPTWGSHDLVTSHAEHQVPRSSQVQDEVPGEQLVGVRPSVDRTRQPHDLVVARCDRQVECQADAASWRAVQTLGPGDHLQPRAENTFMRYKLMLGDRLRARDADAQVAEARLACNILNRRTEL
jgi:hypothetical protein